MQNSTPDFRGGELTAVMGGIELDLRNAGLQNEATLNVFAMWGGIELKILTTGQSFLRSPHSGWVRR
jgi:hypothetical protein